MKHFADKDKHLFILAKGEKLVETLTKGFSDLDMAGGMISGLGALSHAELGYYELAEKTYHRKTFNDEYELISLTGNLSLKDGSPYVHVHAALGDRDFQVFGGHLFEAEVAVTAEITVVPFAIAPERILDPAIGLGLICRLR